MNNKILKKYFKGKNVLITGGTGSFGEYLLRKLLDFKPRKIVIFSRDELKQFHLMEELKEHVRLLDFVIGDVRNFDSILKATKGIDIVYHAAAMKHVPICEENPMEALYTNTLGAYNLKKATILQGVGKVIAISTDKAVRSVNAMGMTKAVAERIILAEDLKSDTTFVCVRFGNVVGSRGSVVPLFKNRIERGKPIFLTDKRMTRFLITLENAMSLIFEATLKGKGGEIFVKKMPVCEIWKLAEVMIEASKRNVSTYPVKFVGSRQGEQLYETLVSEDEMRRAVETGDYFIIYKSNNKMRSKLKTKLSEYRTDLFKERMNKKEIKSILLRSGWL